MSFVIFSFTEGRSILSVGGSCHKNLRMVQSNILHQERKLSLLFLTAGISAQISHSGPWKHYLVSLYFTSQELQEEGKMSMERWLYLLDFSNQVSIANAHFGACHLDREMEIGLILEMHPVTS